MGNVQEIGLIELAASAGRTLLNSSVNSAGTLRINGIGGMLLANRSVSSPLVLTNGPDQPMTVELGTLGQIAVDQATASIVIGSRLLGQAGFVKTGRGTLDLSASNAITGPATVRGGSVVLSSATGGALASVSALRLEQGATAVLRAPGQIGDAVPLILDGGTFVSGGHATGFSDDLGILTLERDSVLRLGGGVHALVFDKSAGATWNNGSVLTIEGWQGAPGGEGEAGRVFFGIGGLTSAQLSQIYFADLGIRGAALIGPHGELTPIPEAPVSAAAAALVFTVLWLERQRLRAWFECMRRFSRRME